MASRGGPVDRCPGEMRDERLVVAAGSLRDQPFTVNLSDLLQRPGARRRVALSGPLALELDQVDDSGPVQADLEIQETGGSVLVRGEVTTSLLLRCNRCLGDVPTSMTISIVQLYDHDPDNGIPEIGLDGLIHLFDVIHDELCLSVPLVPLCSDTCRGLCPICGTDLNVDRCEGHTAEQDSPFAALQGWLETSPHPAKTHQ